ncbi:MAG: outer membrane beta-barrel protein [Saprospiraceae bacterium]
MKNQVLLFLILILTVNSYAQIHFEKGYFIDKSGKRTECLIKNSDWLNNPSSFEYKLSKKGKLQKLSLESSIKVFEIYGVTKYINTIVDMDRSSQLISDLSKEKKPTFQKEHLFLKVLIEGNANLYYYRDETTLRFFYNTNDTKIKQLIYKPYLVDDEIRANNEYKQQLWNNLKCNQISMDNLKELEYNKKSLVPFFEDYHKCKQFDFVNHDIKQKKDLLNLSIRPRFKTSSLSITDDDGSISDVMFDNQNSFSIGLETEVVLPFQKNKWSLFFEPTYSQFKGETAVSTNFTIGDFVIIVDYQSIDLPLGLRHYFFLNDNSKIFVNAIASYDFNLDKTPVILKRKDSDVGRTLYTSDSFNWAFGVGYKLKDRFNIEIRYQTQRDFMFLVKNWNAEFQTTSLILGYTLF